MCSSTNHPGSLRCSLHKNSQHHAPAGSFPSNRLNMRRSAMKNALVRIGGIKGEWVKHALTVLIRPSSHQQRRRSAFEPRPSHLSIKSESNEICKFLISLITGSESPLGGFSSCIARRFFA
ncbi:hypothetical protein V8G54_012780 [Vigna mungo]|uniref:Uncharacterized protein n=1 Tax=Vigna mungo TaxID=3915 RepID=A0AAQ3S4C2_VIGMU